MKNILGIVAFCGAASLVGVLWIRTVQSVRESDARNTRFVVDLETHQLHTAILQSPPLTRNGNVLQLRKDRDATLSGSI